MFRNCGTKIKGIAIIAYILCIVIAVILLIAELTGGGTGSLTTTIILELTLLVAGYIVSLMIYGFGQMVENVHFLYEDQADQNARVRQKKDHDDNDKKLLENGGWQCRCGKVNASYITSCSCGASKFNQK